MQDAAPTHVTGHFTTPDSARAAMVRLEAVGFDADAVDLIGLPDPVDTHAATDPAANDGEAVGDVVKQSGVAAGVGALAGAAAGVVTGVVTGDVGTGAAIGAAAAVGGGVVGGLAGTYTALPVNEAAWTTYELDPDDPHPITVRVRVADDHEARTAKAALHR